MYYYVTTKVRLCQKDARAGSMAVGNKHIYMIYFMPNLQIWTKSEVQILLNCWLTSTGKYLRTNLLKKCDLSFDQIHIQKKSHKLTFQFIQILIILVK